jgi:hypothetical protein
MEKLTGCYLVKQLSFMARLNFVLWHLILVRTRFGNISFHPSGAQKSEVAPRFLETLCTLSSCSQGLISFVYDWSRFHSRVLFVAPVLSQVLPLRTLPPILVYSFRLCLVLPTDIYL